MSRPSATILQQWDKEYVWHPFTQMKDWAGSVPLIIERGEGNYLIDIHGKKYLDAVSSLWCTVHGHRIMEIDRAVKNQLDKIAHSTFLGISHVPAIELSRRLVQIAPSGLKKVFYSDSGSAAVEVALKMAFQYCRQKGLPEKGTFLKLKNAYHGDTLGSVSVGGIDLFHRLFGPLLFKTMEVDAPYAYRDSFRGSESGYAEHCAQKVEKVLRRHHSKICALVAEPLMQGAAGMLKQPRGYLRRLRELTKKYGVLLIVDEVATGFGRTGKMFACEHEGVSPDLMCVAKGITGGYLPLSATLATNEIYDAFLGAHEEFKAFFHGHTYSANPLACAAALANLKLFESRRTILNLKRKIDVLSRQLRPIAGLSHVGDVRQAGLMVGIELVQNKSTKKPYPPAQKMGACVGFEARKHGVLIRPLGNVVVLMPPLSITEKELKYLCSVIRECICKVTL